MQVMLTEQLEDSDLKLQVQLNINESNKKLHEKITDVKLEKVSVINYFSVVLVRP